MNGGKRLRRATAAAVVAIATIAAVVSYTHIEALARAHGQDTMDSALMPLSVDGLILAASLAMLHEARREDGRLWLARSMFWLGVAATIGANVAYGAGYGLLGEVISAWPAIAFIGSAEMVIRLVRVPGQREDSSVQQADTRTAIARAVSMQPDITNDRLAEQLGVSTRTIRRYRPRQAAEG